MIHTRRYGLPRIILSASKIFTNISLYCRHFCDIIIANYIKIWSWEDAAIIFLLIFKSITKYIKRRVSVWFCYAYAGKLYALTAHFIRVFIRLFFGFNFSVYITGLQRMTFLQSIFIYREENHNVFNKYLEFNICL